MKLLLDDTTGRVHGLNANEACVYAAVLKCTKAGRGWFANYRDLAAALPFVISKDTVQRAVQKLLNLGLIVRRDNALFGLSQIASSLSQNETSLSQIETESTSPLNPLINNECMNEKEHATCAPTCDTRTPETPSFNDFLKAYGHAVTPLGELAAQQKWNLCSPIKKRKLIEALSSGNWDKPRPDWCIMDFTEPQPEFLHGDEGGDLVQVRHNGKIRICTRQTMLDHNLPWFADWKISTNY
ncbi:MAG: helix-turn-helix domain-containing protein [Paludibacteraceae bacterium]|nr:helix-turn-helix domain-containing protein [Paludibacteraceae bacterium]